MTNRPISMLPSLLTLCNFSTGFISIILGIQSIFWRGQGQIEKSNSLFTSACLVIFLGMVFDMLDGRVARMTNSQSKLGGELDSLADVCTFGIAPAVILGSLWIRVMPSNAEWWSFAMVVGVIYACCAALRLAIYNLHISDEATGHFSGLPSPGAAGAVVGAALFFSQDYIKELWYSTYDSASENFLNAVTAGRDGRVVGVYAFSLYVMVIGLMMVSNFRFAHAANIWLGKTKKVYTLIFFIIVIALLSLERTRPIVLFLGFNAYILICLFVNIRNRLRHREEDIDRDMEEALNPEGEEVKEEIENGAQVKE